MKKVYLFLLLLVLPCLSIADILPDTYQAGNTIVPSFDIVPVVMDSEKVFIDLKETRCIFWMHNISGDTVKQRVAFPNAGVLLAWEPLKLVVGTEEVVPGTYRSSKVPFEEREKGTARTKKYRLLDSVGYTEYLIWDVTWKPGETVPVELRYRTNWLAFRPGIVEVESLSYVLKTGAYWQGPIGKADIFVDLSNDYCRERKEHTKMIIRPKGYTLHNDTVSWHFTNWEPTEDISVNYCRWMGLDFAYKYGFVGLDMPYKKYDQYDLFDFDSVTEYRGDVQVYNDILLDSLAEKTYKTFSSYFPEEKKNYPLKDLKSLWARILKDQILANNDSVQYPRYNSADWLTNHALIAPYERKECYGREFRDDVKLMNDIEKNNVMFCNKFIKARTRETNRSYKRPYIEKTYAEWEYPGYEFYSMHQAARSERYNKLYFLEWSDPRINIELTSINVENGTKKKLVDIDSAQNYYGYRITEENIYSCVKTQGRFIVYKHKLSNDLLVDTFLIEDPNGHSFNSLFIDDKACKLYLWSGHSCCEYDLNKRQYKYISMTEKGLPVMGDELFITDGFLYCDNYESFYKIDLTNFKISSELPCVAGRKIWYPNKRLNKIFYLEPFLCRVNVIDMRTLKHDGSFYIEKPQNIIEFKDNGSKASILCYRRTGNYYMEIVEVDLKKALKHLDNTVLPVSR